MRGELVVVRHLVEGHEEPNRRLRVFYREAQDAGHERRKQPRDEARKVVRLVLCHYVRHAPQAEPAKLFEHLVSALILALARPVLHLCTLLHVPLLRLWVARRARREDIRNHREQRVADAREVLHEQLPDLVDEVL